MKGARKGKREEKMKGVEIEGGGEREKGKMKRRNCIIEWKN